MYYKNFITSKYQVMIYYKNLISSTLLDIGLKTFFKEEVEKQEFPAFPLKVFENNQKLFSSNLIIYSTYLMRSKEEVELPIPRHILDIPVAMKTFKFSQHLTCID